MTQPTSHPPSTDLPAVLAHAVTPSDLAGNNLTYPCRALYIGGAGNATIVMADSTAILFSGLQAGQILPVRALRVNATGTTATGIVALF